MYMPIRVSIKALELVKQGSGGWIKVPAEEPPQDQGPSPTLVRQCQRIHGGRSKYY